MGRLLSMTTLLLKIYYIFFSFGLLLASFFLTFHAFRNLWVLFADITAEIDLTTIFESVIFITLAMAIFDLAKTTFEEEIIFERDPMKYSEVRRTLTRFLAAVTIAASIEVLTLIFKFSLTRPGNLVYASLLLFGLAFLIASLGVYASLGARAEKKEDTMK